MVSEIERVYERFDEGLRSFISARIEDPTAAEDVLQEVYLKIHARIHTLEDREKIAAWVYRIARNAVYDFYRARRPAQELTETASVPAGPDEDPLERRLSETVDGMLDALPPEYREALRLTEYEGLTQKQLAEKLGISVSGAKSRVQRARTRLKTLLLNCCDFELDRRGHVVNYYARDRRT